MKMNNIEEFEFSQAYLFYWDKIERCYNFLNNVVETAYRGDDLDGRLLSFFLKVSFFTQLKKERNLQTNFFFP